MLNTIFDIEIRRVFLQKYIKTHTQRHPQSELFKTTQVAQVWDQINEISTLKKKTATNFETLVTTGFISPKEIIWNGRAINKLKRINARCIQRSISLHEGDDSYLKTGSNFQICRSETHFPPCGGRGASFKVKSLFKQAQQRYE